MNSVRQSKATIGKLTKIVFGCKWDTVKWSLPSDFKARKKNVHFY